MIRSAAAPALSLVVLIWWNRIHACCDDVAAVSSSSSSQLEKASPLVSLGNLMPLGTLAFDVVPLVTPLSPTKLRAFTFVLCLSSSFRYVPLQKGKDSSRKVK